MTSNELEAPGKGSEMGIGNTGLPEQRAVSAGVVPPAGHHANNILPMGKRGSVRYR